ncbi:SPOR domain-containing protein [Devosia ginsengisoli]|uniref:SPOR domain-containing protein n=1 Tax=Devosia ginsengisoli TaxID=400770 RepID=UPI0026EA517F|nr:SPOR domain-containing protein [Devosia ginsengisoli]MCR6672831.1 SPOR domain-containing protein [Devosia ginsengisoli]
MAGQSDAADDLIAELAKLMAQDAKGDRPAEAAAPAFSVRIPGGDATPATTPAPTPRFDFDRTTALAAEQSAPSAPAEPAADPAPEETPEPFRFDFGLDSPKAAVADAPAEPAAEPPAPADHDSIADLIAAELSSAPEPTPEPAPQPVAAPPVSRATPLPASGAASSVDKPAGPSLDTFNLRPAARPEQDRFKIPPVFGLSSRPAPSEPAVSPVEPAPEAPPPVEPFAGLRQPAPSVAVNPGPAPEDDGLGRDPIDEIEHLIGRAMRVEFDKPAEPAAEDRPVASPALHNLAAVTVPVAAATAQPAAAPRTLSGADEAILAAAEATGAQIGWVEAPEVDEAETVAPAARPRRARNFAISRSLAGPLVAVALLLAAGFGLYWVLGLGGDSGPAPLLTADTSPVKETPAVPTDAAAPPQSVVFNEINGVVPGAEEQLVSRDQADVNEVTQVPPVADVSEEGLANRKVRTVTVRPDGTIVSGDESVAGSTILPVDRPNVPEVPGAETASPELLASADPEPVTPAATPAAEPEVTVTPVQPGSMVPAIDAAGNPLAGKTAPVPMLRPAGLVQATEPMVTAAAPANAVNAVVAPAGGGNLLPPPPANSAFGTTPAATQPVAATQQPAAQQPAAAASIPGAMEVDALPNSAPAYAQLASLRSEEEARQAAQNLVTRFGPLFGGANMEVQRVDLGARGIYYRVRVPAASTSAAANICTNVVAAGGDCVAM